MTTLTLARTALDALKTLRELDGATPTAEQRATLIKWPGWGPLAPAFANTPDGGWAGIAEEIDTLVDDRGRNAAADVIDTSFYTGADVAGAVFDILRQSGFKGGRILEPGCGSGNFMSHAPADLSPISWTGVEIDPTAAAFARALHPDADIIAKPLQKTVFRSNSFDAVVGNVPFAKGSVYTDDTDPASASSSLHEYFILRGLDAVKRGGYVAVVTSRHILDSVDGLQRISEHGALVGAIRLPSNTFDGTSVVADILVFRKHGGDAVKGWEAPYEEIQTPNYYGGYSTTRRPLKHNVVTGDFDVNVSAYFGQHPEHVAGTLEATGYQMAPLRVVTDDIPAAIARATAALAPAIVPMTAEPALSLDDVVLADEDGRKEGSYHLIDGGLAQVVGGKLTAIRNSAELRALIPLRDAAVRLIELESNPDLSDDAIAPTRAEAMSLYDSYVRKYGALNRGTKSEGKIDPDTDEPSYIWRRPTMGGFRKDPDYVKVMALEYFDQDTGTAEPAPILLRRVGSRPAPATSAETAEEALSICLGETGRVNLRRVAELLGVSVLQVTGMLGDLVFTDPANGQTVTARDYLTGNVREKLAIARRAAERDPQTFTRNVTALEEVMPADLGPLEISVQLGAPWISTDIVVDFTRDVFGRQARVERTDAVAYWEVEGGYTREAQLAYGTNRMDPTKLLEYGLNGKAPIVTDEISVGYGQSRRVKNQQETLAAEEKLRAIQERFAIWVWEDETRADKLIREYNRRFNSHVVRRGDGSYLTFPGMDESVSLWSWQRDAVDRVISSERVLIGHPVGSGKTRSIVSSALTFRRMGLARKPLIVVPNHLLDQISREAQQTYPTAKFLIASKEDLAKNSRRLFAARCATGDWDAVVMTQQAFTSIGVDPTTEEMWLEAQKADLRAHLMDQGGTRAGAKRVASQIRTFESKIAALRSNTGDPDGITFEQLGVDHVSVDEAHGYRRLSLGPVRAEGFSLGSSKRATDLLLKIETLAERKPGMPIVALYTGTPWSNTLAETFVWQKYLQPRRLEEAGVAQFDPWAAVFVKYETRVEVAPDGGSFRLYRRPAAMQNVPELRLMLAEVADLLTADEIGLERPDATWHNVVVQQGEQQRAFVKNLADRADDIRNSQKRDIGGVEDNMLMVCNDGRRVALDPELVGIVEKSAAIAAAADSIAENYEAGKDRIYGNSPVPGSFQLVLCDIGTPNGRDGQTYGRLRSELVARGVPAERIRFIHEVNTDKARAHLFSLCREGAVSVLIGSTEKVGVGTNIQTRLAALHHLDAPWRPSDIEQREGRALRPGNRNAHVDIFRFVTEGSFASYMWQALERKARFIGQMYVSSGTIREIEDVSDAVLNYAEVKALAAGNPELLRQAELASEVKRLRTLRAVWLQSINRLNGDAKRLRADAAGLRSKATATREALEVVTEQTPADLDRVHRFAEQLKAGEDWLRTNYRGLTIRISHGHEYDNGSVKVKVGVGYRDAKELIYNRGHLRFTVDHLAEQIAADIDGWVDAASQEINSALRSADRYDADAARCDELVGASVFDKSAELAAAELDLAAIEAAITAEAEERLSGEVKPELVAA
ncbi:N-6 DNA methylase [Agromyces humi]|uniref:N-6 DNA methylase n=1 Tax=Agromyces humi TaxID=1766800 RepID=UPI00135C4675|nr:N-6 DNA methylase [Agromyces humi]